LCEGPNRRMSNGHRSIPGSPSMIQPAIACPAPPAAAIPAEKPQQWNRLSRSSVTPMSGSASGEKGIGPLTQVWMPISAKSGIRSPAATPSGSNRSWFGANSSAPRSVGMRRQGARVPSSQPPITSAPFSGLR
jgi:hypothetical protein